MATALCVRCHEKIEIKDPREVEWRNGKVGTTGFCSICGGKVSTMARLVQKESLTGLPHIRWSDILKWGRIKTSGQMRTFLEEKGTHSVTSDGEEMFVIMRVENYLKETPEVKSRLMRRIDGRMWYSWE